MDLITKLKNSTPTYTEDAVALMIAFVTQENNVIFTSKQLGFTPVENLCDIFITDHACIAIGGELVVSTQPIHVLHQELESKTKLYGLLYSNGVIIYTETSDAEPNLILISDKAFANYVSAEFKSIQSIVEEQNGSNS